MKTLRIQIAGFLLALPASAWGISVVIDPGHGGSETGAVTTQCVIQQLNLSGPVYEKDINLQIALELGNILAARYGSSNVTLTRTDDSTVSLTQRVNITRQAQPDFFISIHADSAGRIASPTCLSGSNGSKSLFYEPSEYTVQFYKDAALTQVLPTPAVSAANKIYFDVQTANIPAENVNVPVGKQTSFSGIPSINAPLNVPILRFRVDQAGSNYFDTAVTGLYSQSNANRFLGAFTANPQIPDGPAKLSLRGTKQELLNAFLSGSIQTGMSALPLKNNGTFTDWQLRGLHYTVTGFDDNWETDPNTFLVPSTLVETGFVDYVNDVNLLTNAAGQQQIAQAIADGLPTSPLQSTNPDNPNTYTLLIDNTPPTISAYDAPNTASVRSPIATCTSNTDPSKCTTSSPIIVIDAADSGSGLAEVDVLGPDGSPEYDPVALEGSADEVEYDAVAPGWNTFVVKDVAGNATTLYVYEGNALPVVDFFTLNASINIAQAVGTLAATPSDVVPDQYLTDLADPAGVGLTSAQVTGGATMSCTWGQNGSASGALVTFPAATPNAECTITALQPGSYSFVTTNAAGATTINWVGAGLTVGLGTGTTGTVTNNEFHADVQLAVNASLGLKSIRSSEISTPLVVDERLTTDFGDLAENTMFSTVPYRRTYYVQDADGDTRAFQTVVGEFLNLTGAELNPTSILTNPFGGVQTYVSPAFQSGIPGSNVGTFIPGAQILQSAVVLGTPTDSRTGVAYCNGDCGPNLFLQNASQGTFGPVDVGSLQVFLMSGSTPDASDTEQLILTVPHLVIDSTNNGSNQVKVRPPFQLFAAGKYVRLKTSYTCLS